MQQPAGIRSSYATLFVWLIWSSVTPLMAGPAAVPPVGPDIREGPRFIVEAISFRAVDETGWDRWGSDEVVIVFRTSTYGVRGREYDYVNSNDDPMEIKHQQTCIVPAIDPNEYEFRWTCSDAGVSGPITFTVGFYEQDINFFPDLSGFSNPQNIDGDLYYPSHSFNEEKSPNDLIGKEKVQISLETLLQKLPRVGDSYRERVTLYGACDHSTTIVRCTTNNTTEYEMIYEVRRVQDVAVPVTPTP